ncbi:uncharacterized protein LOC130204799 [Pseudoliparis swirei]|uniref:uncharacterized protein LOC130204799 n=1 Tax=Pseudoliparis swirei TaxID=2059687 RepID=UPI0024BDEA59|nr:uncharacterized protein LOC130204799 [Pseudoliparis swirei]
MGFQDRHLEDVPFLNHVIVFMIAASTTINMEQGGEVRVGGEILALTSTPQTLHGVELFKDDTGVTLKTPTTNTMVHFDGDTAQVTGQHAAQTGVCGNTETDAPSLTTLGESVNSDHSSAGCDVPQSTDVASTVDCSASDASCDLMSQAPFTDCGNLDPAPFITACKSTACKYAADERPVDFPACQYMEAYAKACKLNTGVTLGAWRSTAGCSTTRLASCLSQDCSDHEFCAGEPGCFCRASFDHPRDKIALITDMQGVSGHRWRSFSMLIVSTEKNDTTLIYKNTIMMGTNSLTDLITRTQLVDIDFSCNVKQPDVKSITFKIKYSSVFQRIENGVVNYSLKMSAFTDAGFLEPVESSTEIELNQRVWLRIETQDLDDAMIAVVTDSCWVTSAADPTSSPSYDLIKDGCPNPADATVEMEGNGLGVSNSFSFLMFEYAADNTGVNPGIYLHCKVQLYPKEPSSIPNCGASSRKRRSARPGYAQGGHALISMVWNN